MTMQWKPGDRITCDLSFNQIELSTTAGVPDGYIAGVASTPGTDHHGHKVLARAFDDSIKTKGLSGPRGIQLLAGHDWTKVAGGIKRLETVKDDLMIEAQLYMDVSYVKDLHTVLKQNGGLNFSVGFGLIDFAFNDVAEKDDDPWLIIKKGDLMEVSIVTFPSQPDAIMTFVKELDTISEFERMLMSEGLANSRNQAHKLALWAKQNVHLLQPKAPLPEREAPPQHPLLDVSMFNPVRELLAKARAQLP